MLACTALPIKHDTIVPVVTVVHEDIPAPAVVETPDIPITHITETSTQDEIIEAYAASVQILENYAAQLRAALQPYIDAAAASLAPSGGK